MSHIVLSEFAVRTATGDINQDATVQKFRTALVQFADDLKSKETRIAQAIEAVLTENQKSQKTTLDFVTGQVASKLNGNADNYGELKASAADYIRVNACGEKNGSPVDSKTGAVLSEPRRYFLGKGRDGGVRRWKDHLAMKAAKAAKSDSK